MSFLSENYDNGPKLRFSFSPGGGKLNALFNEAHFKIGLGKF